MASQSSTEDPRWMRHALALAEKGAGQVEPNPMVGCVLVSGQTEIGSGYHARFGGDHAERAAIADARRRGHQRSLAGCTAYVTLEPCCHHGKTPPCTDALIDSGVSRVVVAMLDPFEEVRGKGLQRLRSAGIETVVGVEETAARELNAPYLKRIEQNRPWIIAKWAMSLDGRMATRSGHSQWISCQESRSRVHRLRGTVDAILVGSGTALADDPLLTARGDTPPLRTAVRVVVDSTLQLPTTSRLARTAGDVPVLLWAGPHANHLAASRLSDMGCQVHISEVTDPADRLDALLRFLAEDQRATNVLVEGGSQLFGGLLELKQIDQCDVFVAPKLIGGSGALSPISGLGFAHVDEGPAADRLHIESSGQDVHLRCRLTWGS